MSADHRCIRCGRPTTWEAPIEGRLQPVCKACLDSDQLVTLETPRGVPL